MVNISLAMRILYSLVVKYIQIANFTINTKIPFLIIQKSRAKKMENGMNLFFLAFLVQYEINISFQVDLNWTEFY